MGVQVLLLEARAWPRRGQLPPGPGLYFQTRGQREGGRADPLSTLPRQASAVWPRCPSPSHAALGCPTLPLTVLLCSLLSRLLVVPGVPCCHTLPLTVLLCPSVSPALPHCLLMSHATPHCPSLSLVVLRCPTLGPRCPSHSAARGHRGERGGGPWTEENTQKRPRGWKRRETPREAWRPLGVRQEPRPRPGCPHC